MKVNAIIYVSTSKVNVNGRLIDAGVSGISGFVEEHQQLFNKEFYYRLYKKIGLLITPFSKKKQLSDI